MKSLIVFYSFSGNNALLAEVLKDRLVADFYQIREVKARTGMTLLLDMLFQRGAKIYKPSLSLKRYDQVILVAPVWNARIASPLKAFVQYYREELPPYSLLTVCGGRSGQQEKLESQIKTLAGKPPTLVVQFPLNELVPAARKKQISHGVQLKIEKPDLSYLDASLDQVIQKLRMYETI